MALQVMALRCVLMNAGSVLFYVPLQDGDFVEVPDHSSVAIETREATADQNWCHNPGASLLSLFSRPSSAAPRAAPSTLTFITVSLPRNERVRSVRFGNCPATFA